MYLDGQIYWRSAAAAPPPPVLPLPLVQPLHPHLGAGLGHPGQHSSRGTLLSLPIVMIPLLFAQYCSCARRARAVTRTSELTWVHCPDCEEVLVTPTGEFLAVAKGIAGRNSGYIIIVGLQSSLCAAGLATAPNTY